MKNWRIGLVLIIFFIFSAAIISRLIYFQIINHKYWAALAQGQQKFFVASQGERGEIFFQDKTNLAVNQIFPLVYVVPNEIKNQEEASEALSLILNLEKNSILEKFQKDSLYVLLKKEIDRRRNQ